MEPGPATPASHPSRRGVSAEPLSSAGKAANLSVRTPGQLARSIRASSMPHRTPTAQTGAAAAPPRSGRRNPAGEGAPSSDFRSSAGPRNGGGGGLSASARQLKVASVTNKATPHARRAIEVYKGRRTAIFNTPGRSRGRAAQRRQSHGVDQQKDGPFDALRHLSRRLAPVSRRVVTSSSPGSRRESALGSEAGPSMLVDSDDDDSGFMRKRPRLSLPIDVDSDDDDLQRPRTSGLEDEDHSYIVMSVEQPRRAVSERPWGRLGRDSLRMSDFFGAGQGRLSEDDTDGHLDRGILPPPFNLADGYDDGDERPEDVTFERLDSPLQRDGVALGRQSDFGTIEVPIDIDSPFRLDPQLRDSPELTGPVFDEPTPITSVANLSQLGGDPEPGYLEQADVSDAEAGFADPFDNTGGADVGPAGYSEGEAEDDEAEDDEDRVDMTGDQQTVANSNANAAASSGSKKRKRTIKLSSHGIPCPSLPQGVVKRLAQNIAATSGVGNTRVSPETLQKLMEATDWFFDQLGVDLAAYAKHAGRKTIEESDVLTLMKRQRRTNSQTTAFSLAQRHLPRELLQELRMTPRAVGNTRHRRMAPALAHEEAEGVDDEDVT